jgi:hypothetical protein
MIGETAPGLFVACAKRNALGFAMEAEGGGDQHGQCHRSGKHEYQHRTSPWPEQRSSAAKVASPVCEGVARQCLIVAENPVHAAFIGKEKLAHG